MEIKPPPMLNYDSVPEIKALLEQMGLSPRKKWGQNYLINKGAREKILAALGLYPGDRVWEIGPGLGAMTSMLLQNGFELTAFEIDPGYVEYLGAVMSRFEQFHLIQGDVLKRWEEVSLSLGKPDIIMGNLPYNVASTIISRFIEKDFLPRKMVFTVQKEMGDRMVASTSSKNYSSFSILCQSACRTRSAGVLKPGSFYPRPGVSSIIIELEPRKDISMQDKFLFNRLVRDMFISRRKTLNNNIKRRIRLADIPAEQIAEAFTREGIDLGRRPETVEVEEFAAVSNTLFRFISEV